MPSQSKAISQSTSNGDSARSANEKAVSSKILDTVQLLSQSNFGNAEMEIDNTEDRFDNPAAENDIPGLQISAKGNIVDRLQSAADYDRVDRLQSDNPRYNSSLKCTEDDMKVRTGQGLDNSQSTPDSNQELPGSNQKSPVSNQGTLAKMGKSQKRKQRKKAARAAQRGRETQEVQ